MQMTRKNKLAFAAIAAALGVLIPEPASLALLAIGGVGLMIRRRERHGAN